MNSKPTPSCFAVSSPTRYAASANARNAASRSWKHPSAPRPAASSTGSISCSTPWTNGSPRPTPSWNTSWPRSIRLSTSATCRLPPPNRSWSLSPTNQSWNCCNRSATSCAPCRRRWSPPPIGRNSAIRWRPPVSFPKLAKRIRPPPPSPRPPPTAQPKPRPNTSISATLARPATARPL